MQTDHQILRAGNGTRTRDPNLGKVVLYQLSYSRTSTRRRSHLPTLYHPTYRSATTVTYFRQPSGGEGNRTPDLLNAIQALSQLSYAPGTCVETCVTTGRARTRSRTERRTNTEHTFPAGTTIYSGGYM